MIDRQARDQLAELVRHLMAGTMGVCRFVEAGGKIALRSQDAGVRAVFDFAAGMCEDDLADTSLKDMWADRLPTCYRKSGRIRRKMAIAALFLYSDAEYKWPPLCGPRVAGLDCLLMLGCILCVAVAFVAFGFGLRFPAVLEFSWLFLAASIWVYRYSQRMVDRALAEWEDEQRQIGAYDVWPFMRDAEFDEARDRPRLLCGR
jgi:hypothetical protein